MNAIKLDMEMQQPDLFELLQHLRSTIKIALMIVTPDLARTWLTQNKRNRKLNQAHSKKLGRDMLAGRWVFTGMPVVFDATGALVNGQHTLQAVVDTGVSIPALVINGVDPKVIFAYDDLRKRTFADLLRIHGKENCSLVQSICTLVLRCERKQLGTQNTSSYSNAEMDDCLNRNQDVQDAADYISSHRALTAIFIPRLVGFARWRTQRFDKDRSDLFFEQLNGIGLSDGDPVLLLRNRITDLRSQSRFSHEPMYELAMIIKAWNLTWKGAKIKMLKFQDGEQFPAFDFDKV